MKNPIVSQFKVGQKVLLKEIYTYPTEASIAAVSLETICVKLQDEKETLIVFYLDEDGWHPGSDDSFSALISITVVAQ